MTSLRTSLGLDPGASLEAVANCLHTLLGAERRELAASLLPASADGNAAAVADLPAAQHTTVVAVNTCARRRELQAAADVMIERLAASKKWPKVGGEKGTRACTACPHRQPRGGGHASVLCPNQLQRWHPTQVEIFVPQHADTVQAAEAE